MTTDGIIELAAGRGLGLAVAESCTGGRIAAALTADPGASEAFLGGVVAYHNEVKTAVLGVERETLELHGAVSEQVARQMARGVRRRCGADLAVATTGIAGPGGGSPRKPVGTVWIATATKRNSGEDGEDRDSEKDREDREDRNSEKDGTAARCFHFSGSRAEIMAAATRAALEMLEAAISGLEMRESAGDGMPRDVK